MLRRIFHFERLPAQGGAPAAAPGSAAAAAAAPAAASPQHRWRSSFTLTDAEAQFVEAVLEHRQPRMMQGRALDDKEVIPPGELQGCSTMLGLLWSLDVQQSSQPAS